jgi:hypothetical protein
MGRRSLRAPVAPIKGLRYNHREGYFELKCYSCHIDGVGVWWPLTLDNWKPKSGYTRCRSCASRHDRELLAARRSTINERNRQYYKENGAAIRAKQAARDHARWEEKKAYARKKYVENGEAIRAYRRTKYAEKRRLSQEQVAAAARLIPDV